MTEEQIISKFIEMHENPDSMTEEELSQCLDDEQMHDLAKQMAFVKRTLVSEDEKLSEPNLDSEWTEFEATHSAELNALDDESEPSKARPLFNFSKYRNIAAVFLGILLFTGISYAAIQLFNVFRQTKTSEEINGSSKGRQNEKSTFVIKEKTVDSMLYAKQAKGKIEKDDSLKSTTPIMQSLPDTVSDNTVVFNNETLERMLSQISQYHNMIVLFQNEKMRKLRFHFIWNHEDGIDKTVERLNNFETLNILVENNTIVVK